MEYFHEGDLTKHIGKPLQQETVQNISRQILEGLKVMHRVLNGRPRTGSDWLDQVKVWSSLTVEIRLTKQS